MTSRPCAINAGSIVTKPACVSMLLEARVDLLAETDLGKRAGSKKNTLHGLHFGVRCFVAPVLGSKFWILKTGSRHTPRMRSRDLLTTNKHRRCGFLRLLLNVLQPASAQSPNFLVWPRPHQDCLMQHQSDPTQHAGE